MRIPERGQDAEALLATLETYRAKDIDWRSGRTFAYVYDAGREAEAVGKRAYAAFLTENALDPTAFPSLLRLENELVSMGATHLSGGPEVAGNLTTGGTESIILAVKAARDRARALRPEVTRPNMVLPVTAHAAFHKAAWFLGVEPVPVEVDPGTFRAGPDQAKDAIGPDTVLVVGSAPSYAHGVCDDIPGLAALARDHGIPMHVDACVGGWMLPFFRRLGADVPAFDFSVPGVTSISMDLHKYAFCPKGASLILHRDKSYREHQIFSFSGWTGYTIVNPTVLSTRSGGPMAAAWATLRFIGADGYESHARALLDATRRIVDGVSAIPGLRVMGSPDFCLVAVASDEVNVFHVVDEMNRRGWYIQAQLGFRGHAANFHLSVHPGVVGRVDEMLGALAECVEIARGLPPTGLSEMVKGAVETLDLASIPPEAFAQLLAVAGIQGTTLPERTAGINEILDALPTSVREELLRRFFNDLNHIGDEGAP